MWNKIRNFLDDSCDIMELILAGVVLIGILVACFSLWEPFLVFVENRFERGTFLVFVGHVFDILIGIEFLKLLCRPNANTIMEVLTFLVARHMIIEHTTAVENLLSIISIAVLFAMKKYLDLPTGKENMGIFVANNDLERLNEKHKKRREKIIQEKGQRLKQQVKSMQPDEEE